MSEHEKPKDLVSHLLNTHRFIRHVTSGEHTGPRTTAAARIALLLFVLAFGGSILWHGLLAMPADVAVFLGLVIALRIGIWYWRRHH